MTKNNRKGKKYIEITAAILASACLIVACSCNKEVPKATYSYGPELGLASGNVDLSGDSPDISISDIKSPAGENIDFLSDVTVINEEDYEDLEIWVDASTIDIFTPGNYKATYTFNFNGKSVSKEINVTIIESKTTEPEAPESNIATSNSPSTNVSETQTNSNYASEEKPTTTKPSSTTKPQDSTNGNSSSTQETTSQSNINTTKPNTTTKPSSEQTTKPVNTTKPGSTTKPNSGQTTKPVQTTKPNSTTKPNTGQTTTKKETTTRQIITTAGNTTTSNKHIANYTIELLSGKTITVKNTTSKYIVSTRTDVSEITRNGSKYKVSKLIIRYNTGAEQILEIVEEKIG